MGLLDIFKKNPRDEWDRHAKDVKYKKFKLDRAQSLYDDNIHSDFTNNLPDMSRAFLGSALAKNLGDAERDYDDAKKRINKLYENSQAEAIKLNKKYDSLVNKYGKGSEEVYGFERDRLGMHKRKGLVAITSIVGLIAGIFFLSPNLTGNVIGDISNSASNIIGVIFLIIGLVGSFFWFRRR